MNPYSPLETQDNQKNVWIDLRSDTVTRPSVAMREAMLTAKVGDDVYGEDPTVIHLETSVAELLQKPAALFFPTGTQSNLTALLAHCQRGEEILLGDCYHTFSAEARGASVLGGIALHPLATDAFGQFSIDDMIAAIKPDDPHSPITRLLSLENTVAGCIQDQNHIKSLVDAAHQQGLKAHLDGARLFNAAVAQGKNIATLTRPFDSVSVCLSKGLGAPAGSVLAGEEHLIQYARRQRKMLGGGMRQAGMLAAAGLYALEHQVECLQEDHLKAQQLAQGLNTIPEIAVDMERVQTNMVFIRPDEDRRVDLVAQLQKQGVVMGSAYGNDWIRCVLHRDIALDDIDDLVTCFKDFYRSV